MIEFKQLSISNVLSYDKAVVKFDGTVKRIFGLNRDAASDSGITGNGVGKSLLFSTLVNALYFHSPLSVVKAKTKDIISEKTRLCLLFSSNNVAKKIVQDTKGFTLYENQVDLETRTVPLAKEQIRKWFPLSEEEFFTTTFVSSQRPYLLQQSTDVSRLELLSKLFQLNDYAKLKEIFSQKLRNIKDFEIKASVYKQHKGSLKNLKTLIFQV
jgi:DNA repair exonuclease SbcCD ATPase subunit